MQKFEDGAIGAGLRPASGCCGAVALALLVAVASPVAAAPQEATDPRLVEISKEHCLAFYDAVELQLKGKGDEVTSVTTRNGLKDFFVVRPGEVDCTGEREIPWRDDKDRNFIKSVLEAAGDSLKPKINLMETYAIGPAPRATVPRR
jgi:hypothetical protein